MNGIYDTREYRANETEKTNIGLIREWTQPNKKKWRSDRGLLIPPQEKHQK